MLNANRAPEPRAAARLLVLSEAGAKKAEAGARVHAGGRGGVAGTHACAFVRRPPIFSFPSHYWRGREPSMGYFQGMYGLNVAHCKFTKLYKTVFPAGLDGPAPSRKVSQDNLAVPNSTSAASSSLSVVSSRNASPLSISTIADSSPVSGVASTPDSLFLGLGGFAFLEAALGPWG
ncbi:hypothetical protein K438DRAFT_1961552 [Mycena galopus ATCC 62051]|nr:hypothetical protein K438DRAFT_1961552 [Mycena galopus ATCC 62051]